MKFLKPGATPRKVQQIFLKEGWQIVRSTGHFTFEKNGQRAQVPMQGKQPIGLGTLSRLDRILSGTDTNGKVE
jgi:predicted RNA binding protein YcfA (HicA-like mRNA interferase family)